MFSLANHAAVLIRTVCPQEGVGVDLNAAVNSVIAARPVRRRNDNFWPSSINSPYDCDRRQALSRVEGIWTDAQRTDPQKIREMDIGTALHALMQRSYLAMTRRLYGHWKCPSCLTLRRTFTTYPNVLCDGVVTVSFGDDIAADPPVRRTCAAEQQHRAERGEPVWLYEEIRVRDDLGISGKCDGIYLLPSGKWYTLEIKTLKDLDFSEQGVARIKVDPKKYPELAKLYDGAPMLTPAWSYLPRGYHTTQAAIYTGTLLLMCDSGELPLNADSYAGTLLLYVNRQTGQIRHFFRRNTAAEYARARATVIATRLVVEKARALPAEQSVRRAFVLSSLPAQCSSRTVDMALACPWRTVCFPYQNPKKNVVTYL